MTSNTLTKNRYLVSLLLGFVSLSIILIFGMIFRTQFEEWEEKSLDYRFRLHKPIEIYPKITTIGIGDISLSEIGGWPWKRSIHARMLKLLASFGASVINMDITFTTRTDDEEDRQLIEAVQEADNVILSAGFALIDHPCFTEQEYATFVTTYPESAAIVQSLATKKDGNICVDVDAMTEAHVDLLEEEAFWKLIRHDEFVFATDDEQRRAETMFREVPYPFSLQNFEPLPYANRVSAPLEPLSEAAAGLGHISATPDSDGVFRRVPLVIRAQNHLYPSLALATVLYYLQVPPEHVTIIPGKHILLKQAKFPGTGTIKDLTIPVDSRLQVRINYPHSWTHLRPQSFVEVLQAEQNPQQAEQLKRTLNDHICTIGFFSTGTGDIGPNPLETTFYLALIHPTVMNMILTENFLYDTGWGLNIGITIFLVCFIAFIAPKLGPLRFTLVWFLTLTGSVGIATVLFNTSNIILKLINPLLPTLILEYTLITVYWYATEERERRQLRSAFKTYVSRQMLAQILDNPQSLTLSGQRKEISIMFSDIRKFSTLSDKIEPEVIHRLLNMYFSRMTEIAFKYDGFVDKFIGDGLLCFFGDPLFHPDHALRAVRAAIDMQKAVRELGPEIREKLKIDPVVIRIGINTGYVIVGNMGSAERMEYTVLGSDVNLAQRLEASATPGQIMISHRTYEQVKQEIDTREIGEIKVKGFEHAVQVYEVNLPFR